MHVIMITNVVAPDKLGGLERYVRELSAELVRQNHHVTVVSKRTSEAQLLSEVSDDGVAILRYDMPQKTDPLFGLKYPFAAAIGVRRALRVVKASASGIVPVVHGHFPVPMVYLALLRRPYVYTCHAPAYKEILDERQGSYKLPKVLETLIVRGLKFVERLVIKRALTVVTLSDFIAGEVAEMGAKRFEDVQRIVGGLDTTWFSPDGALDTGEHSPNIFTARRLVKRTGVESLIRSMPRVLENEPKAKLTVAGDGPLRKHLEETVRKLELSDVVKFTGRVSEEELLALYRSADIAVTPTRSLEGFGLSTVEAMATGTVPLVTPIGANPEVVSNLSPRLVTSGIDPEELAFGIVNLWRSAEFDRIKEGVRKAVHPEMSWPVVAAKYVGIYDDSRVLPGPSKGRASPQQIEMQ